ncbi:formin-binding protein 4-like [Elysia marginata]|uniref:Formin-binding protein 4-like n=1 Tax=Elysia marginata TaxID=1093978 RepID=A0AAV4JXE2_9GAST|nr:formin-binding protein 4-like [Elysia marginata]
MSRKRKPVLQLGAGSTSKLRKSSLPTLVGSYSDSEGDDSAMEQEEQRASGAVTEPLSTSAQTSSYPHPKFGNGDAAAGDNDKTQDMDDELKNFLSEIEAIPMPDGGAGNQEEKSNHTEQNHPSSFPSKPAGRQSAAEEGSQPTGDPNSQNIDSSSSTKKRKPQYSMFVKGASEFVHSPSSQEADASSTKQDENIEKLEEEIPEDEGSQYYYYWNTLTNEVTWEIPSEYTQFLLLHREFTEKLARLPPNVLKAYEERKAKEAKALAAASTQATSAAASNSAEAEQTVYGPSPVDRSSPAPTSSTAEGSFPSSSIHNSHKKHKKEKKKKRHKRRHSDSGSDSSEAEDNSGASKTLTYGPQLPQKKHPPASSSTSTSKPSTGSQPSLSIVPYLSDADEDENAESDNATTGHVAGKVKTVSKSHINSSNDEGSVKNKSGSAEARLQKDISKLVDIPGKTRDEPLEAGEGSEVGLKLDGDDTCPDPSKSATKGDKPSKQVIDMFAEDAPLSQSLVGSNQKSLLDDENKAEKDEKVSTSSRHTSKDDDSSKAANATAHSSYSKSSSLASKALVEANETRDKNDAPSLLSIVGYASDEEEQTMAEDKDSKVRRLEVNTKETLPSSKQPLSPTESKKRKKEKKKHKHEDKERKEKGGERRDISPPNILGGNLRKDIKAKVEETLDKEISDIVIHTVSQVSFPISTGKSSSTSLAGKEVLPDQEKLSEKETEKSKRTKEDNKKEAKILKEVKPAAPEGLSEKAEQPEKEIHNGKDKGGDEDDDDIDFEDLDDLDRALEVALEKKKVELAKYEEQERKQEKLSAQVEKVENQPDTEMIPLTSEKVEPTDELEEKLKMEVKDAAELALNKLEFLDIATDNLSRLQILFIELQTRLTDWTAGGLSTVYFREQLGIAQGLLDQYEQSAVPQGWACQWDRGNNRYYYRNLTTNRIQWDYPEDEPVKPSAEKSGEGVDNDNKSVDSADKSRKEKVEKKPSSSSSSKQDKTRERGSSGRAGSSEDKDGLRKKGGSSSSRHRKREERDKDRGSKHDKRRDGSSSSHRYRRKRRRRRDHSSSSDSSDDDGGGGGGGGGDSTNTTAGKSNSVTSSSSRKHHRHHHKASKKKKKRRSEQRSRTPSVEIVVASDDGEGSGKVVA